VHVAAPHSCHAAGWARYVMFILLAGPACKLNEKSGD
jgi:hypothetical protein